jgi:hypothetical protein
MGKRTKNLPGTPGAAAADVLQVSPWATVPGLARELGVAEARVELLLGSICEAGADFDDEHGTVLFTYAGAQKIRAAIEEQMVTERDVLAAEREPQDATAPAAGSPRREDLTLTRVFRWSTNVMAERANGLEVVLRVKSIAHLQQGMVLKACIEGLFGWTYEGRLPRTIGERQHYFPCTHK